MVDFAIFETGVWNTFWLFVAILVACRHNNSAQDDRLIVLNAPKRFPMLLILTATVIGCLAVAVVPPVKANRLFRRALIPREPQFDYLDWAIKADALSPDTAHNAAGMLAGMYSAQRPMVKDPSLLERAKNYVGIAHQRNPGAFKPCRLSAEINLLLADQAEDDQKTEYLQEAYTMLSKARDRYPGSDQINYNLGRVAEQLNRPEQALSHYQSAVEIEQVYQAQFKVMYPDRRPVISRLGNTAYIIAQTKIEELQKKLNE
jgi:tetratricopeptide (TPR) repeat protein